MKTKREPRTMKNPKTTSKKVKLSWKSWDYLDKYENQPKTTRNRGTTFKNYENQSKCMKIHETTLKNNKKNNQPGQF